MVKFAIHEQPLRIERWSPAQRPDDVEARRCVILRSIELMAPLIQPLSIEIVVGPMDPETFRVLPEYSKIIEAENLPVGVASESMYSPASEIVRHPILTRRVIEESLTVRDGWDVAHVQTLASAARVDNDDQDLVIEQFVNVRVPTITQDGMRWVAGPIDVPGYRLFPPIGVRWIQEWGDLQLRVDTYWGLWWDLGSREHTYLRDLEKRFDENGFRRSPNGA